MFVFVGSIVFSSLQYDGLFSVIDESSNRQLPSGPGFVVEIVYKISGRKREGCLPQDMPEPSNILNNAGLNLELCPGFASIR